MFYSEPIPPKPRKDATVGELQLWATDMMFALRDAISKLEALKAFNDRVNTVE